MSGSSGRTNWIRTRSNCVELDRTRTPQKKENPSPKHNDLRGMVEVDRTLTRNIDGGVEEKNFEQKETKTTKGRE